VFEIKVEHRDGVYIAHGERGALARTGKLLRGALPEARRALTVTDERIRPLYLKSLLQALVAADFEVGEVTTEAGEVAKNEQHLAGLYRAFAQARIHAGDVVVALGGGSVLDVSGFAAATFKKGVPWAAVPTTVLSQIDLCLGGDVGVDFEGAKNQVGTFHHPSAVVIDGELLATLPGKDLAAGLAEAAKYALLEGEDFFGYLEDNAAGLLRAGPALDAVVERGLSYKAAVLSAGKDTRRERRLLRLGHTLGHAFEAATRYALPHGEAVAVGLVYTALLSELRGELATEVVIRLVALLRRFHLPTHLPALHLDKILAALVPDGGTVDGDVYVAMPRAVGQTIVEPVPLRAVAELLPQVHRLARSMA
jgi:3-dehydroquinate synthase